VCGVRDIAFGESTTLEKTTKGCFSSIHEFTNDTSICGSYFSSTHKFTNGTSICRTYFLLAHKFMETWTTTLKRERSFSLKNKIKKIEKQ